LEKVTIASRFAAAETTAGFDGVFQDAVPAAAKQEFLETCVNIPLEPNRSARRAGFTLFEVLLVLAILVILGAFTWPVLRGVIANEKLRNAAYQVRTAWARARIEAMNSGCAQRFTYDPLSGEYCVESSALESDDEVFSEYGTAPLGFGGSTSSEFSGESLPLPREETLPEGIHFATLEAADSIRDTIAEQLPGSFTTTRENRSRPLFFYPDGTTSTARIILGNDQGRGIVVSLRGLTGIVTVGEITALEKGVQP
jgi:prepilin-type N-terminal cleavage/methylation domain-containing protein